MFIITTAPGAMEAQTLLKQINEKGEKKEKRPQKNVNHQVWG